MIEYIIGAALGAVIASIITWFAMNYGFKCFIEAKSKENGSVSCFGENYFFMTKRIDL